MPSTPTEAPEPHEPNSAANIPGQHENNGFQTDKTENHLSLSKDSWNGDTSVESHESGGYQAEACSGHLNVNNNATVVIGNGCQELTARIEPSEMLIRAPQSTVISSYNSACEGTSTQQPLAPTTEKPLAPTTEKPLAPTTDKPLAPVADKPLAPVADKPLAPVADKPVAPATDKPVAPATDKPVAPATDKPVAPATDKPVAPATDKPVAPATDKPVVPTTEKPLAPATDKPVESMAEKPAESAAQEHINNKSQCLGEDTKADQAKDTHELKTEKLGEKSTNDRLAPTVDSLPENEEAVKVELPAADGDTSERIPNEPLDILGNGLLLKKVIKYGKGETTRPLQGHKVTLRTKGVLPDGTVVDENESITFILGDGDVIAGWDIVVALLGLNEVSEVTCDAKYAYGSQGRFPDIPGNTTITYELELLDKESGPNYSLIPLDERLRYASVKKERGNYLFARNDFHGAINSYVKAISIIDQEGMFEVTEKTQQIHAEKIKCFNNLAAAQLKIERYHEAIKSCEEVVKHDPSNVKALFRMGRAYAAEGETKDAITQMKKALKLEPETKIIHQELSKLTKKLSKETQSERNMCKKMFRTDKPSSAPSSDSSSWKWSILAGSFVVVLLSLGVAYFR
ncbi:peptidyl-prolyl cis-trans isomerase FKBP8-like isoform X1 [Argonauta hians]